MKKTGGATPLAPPLLPRRQAVFAISPAATHPLPLRSQMGKRAARSPFRFVKLAYALAKAGGIAVDDNVTSAVGGVETTRMEASWKVRLGCPVHGAGFRFQGGDASSGGRFRYRVAILTKGLETFEPGQLGGLFIEAPKALALQRQRGGHMQDVIGTEAMPRGVAQGDVLKLGGDFGERHIHQPQRQTLREIIAKLLLAGGGKLGADPRLRFPKAGEHGLLESVNHLQPREPNDGEDGLLSSENFLCLSCLRAFEIEPGNEVGVSVGTHSPAMSLSSCSLCAFVIIGIFKARRRAAKSG